MVTNKVSNCPSFDTGKGYSRAGNGGLTVVKVTREWLYGRGKGYYGAGKSDLTLVKVTRGWW